MMMIDLLITLQQTEQGEAISTKTNVQMTPIVALGLLEAAKQSILTGNLQVIKQEQENESND